MILSLTQRAMTIKPIPNFLEISTQPDQFTTEIFIEINAHQEEHCILSFFHQSGRVLRMMGVNINPGTQKIAIPDLENLPVGKYQLHIRDATGLTLYIKDLIKK
jgi:hypothetical protein